MRHIARQLYYQGSVTRPLSEEEEQTLKRDFSAVQYDRTAPLYQGRTRKSMSWQVELAKIIDRLEDKFKLDFDNPNHFKFDRIDFDQFKRVALMYINQSALSDVYKNTLARKITEAQSLDQIYPVLLMYTQV